MAKRNNLVNDKKYHYTYRITNIKEKKYYYGVHSCNCLPKEDIGIKYFSSSNNREFKLDQKQNPSDYKYKVIKIFFTRGEAEEHEKNLHKIFNVRYHKSFYNRWNANEKFNSIGIPAWCKGLKLSEEHKAKISIGSSGSNNGMYGKKHSEETKLIFSQTHKGKEPWNKGLKMPEDFPGNIRVLKEVICPYCSLIGKGGNMTRYHFDNCKQKENNNG